MCLPRPWCPLLRASELLPAQQLPPEEGGPRALRTQAPDCPLPPPSVRELVPSSCCCPAPGPASHTPHRRATGAAGAQLCLVGLLRSPSPSCPSRVSPWLVTGALAQPLLAQDHPPSSQPLALVPGTSSEGPRQVGMSGPGDLAPSSSVPRVTCQSGLSLPKGPSQLVSVPLLRRAGGWAAAGLSPSPGTAAPLNPPTAQKHLCLHRCPLSTWALEPFLRQVQQLGRICARPRPRPGGGSWPRRSHPAGPRPAVGAGPWFCRDWECERPPL